MRMEEHGSAGLPCSPAAAWPAQRSPGLSLTGVVQEHRSSHATACSPAGAGCVSGVRGRQAAARGAVGSADQVLWGSAVPDAFLPPWACAGKGSGHVASPGALGCGQCLKV